MSATKIGTEYGKSHTAVLIHSYKAVAVSLHAVAELRSVVAAQHASMAAKWGAQTLGFKSKKSTQDFDHAHEMSNHSLFLGLTLRFLMYILTPLRSGW